MQNVSREHSSQDIPENSIIGLKDGTGTRDIRTDTAEVHLQELVELTTSFASPVEGRGGEGIQFLQVVAREPKDCKVIAKAVVPEEAGKWARVVEVVLEVKIEPCYLRWSVCP